DPLKRMATDWTGRVVPPSKMQNGTRALFYRQKSGFGAPIYDWFNGALGRDLRDRLVAAREEWEPFVDIPAVLEELRRGPVSVNRSFQLWSLYAAVVWRDRVGAGPGTASNILPLN